MLVSNEVKRKMFFDEAPVVASRLEQLYEVCISRNLEGLAEDSFVTRLFRLLAVFAVLLLLLIILFVFPVRRIGFYF